MTRDRTGLANQPFGAFLTDLLNGRDTVWCDDWSDSDFVGACRTHGVSAWVAEQLLTTPSKIPESALDSLTAVRNAGLVFDKLHRAEVSRVVDHLHRLGILTVLLKGTPLAYSLYPSPHLRTRGDTDLLIDEDQQQAVDAAFAELGYERHAKPMVQFQSYQDSYGRTDALLATHVFDVHRRINNRQLFAAAFTWDELLVNRCPLPAIGSHAQMLTPPFQLLHACLHRVSHLHAPHDAGIDRHIGDRLIWFKDIQLLSAALSDTEWSGLVDACVDKKICALVLDSLQAAGCWFPVSLPDFVSDRLRNASAEPSASLLRQGRLGPILQDLVAIEGLGHKLTLAREIAFPPADYVLQKYDKASRWWLPWLYVRRATAWLIGSGRT